MQIVPIDLVEVLAVFMGISIVLVPVIGLTARFALKPTVEAFSRFFEHKGLDESVHILERRMALMEQQIETMGTTLERLVEVSEFHRALDEGDDGGGARGRLGAGDTASPEAGGGAAGPGPSQGVGEGPSRGGEGSRP